MINNWKRKLLCWLGIHNGAKCYKIEKGIRVYYCWHCSKKIKK